MKKYLVILLALALCLGSCVFAQAEECTIGVSLMTLENSYFVNVMNGMQAYADEQGINMVFKDSGYDVSQQVSDVETLINLGVNGIIITPIDQNALHDIVKASKEAGIPVLAMCQEIDNASGQFCSVEYEYGSKIGTNAANWINAMLADEAEVQVIIISQDNVETVIERANGIEDTIKKNCPNAVIVARQAGDTTDAAMTIAENCLTQFPDAKIIACVNDSAALGACEAVMGLGYNSDVFGVFGADATAEAVAKMAEEGSIFRGTVDAAPIAAGRFGVETIVRYITQGVPAEQEFQVMQQAIVTQKDVQDGTFPG